MALEMTEIGENDRGAVVVKRYENTAQNDSEWEEERKTKPKKGDKRGMKYHETCRCCGREFAVGPVWKQDAACWLLGPRPLVQNCFPYLEPWEREAISQRTCKRCQEKMYPPWARKEA